VSVLTNDGRLIGLRPRFRFKSYDINHAVSRGMLLFRAVSLICPNATSPHPPRNNAPETKTNVVKCISLTASPLPAVGIS
jgi:hypothetical protein